jgi:hypothetical protein
MSWLAGSHRTGALRVDWAPKAPRRLGKPGPCTRPICACTDKSARQLCLLSLPCLCPLFYVPAYVCPGPMSLPIHGFVSACYDRESRSCAAVSPGPQQLTDLVSVHTLLRVEPPPAYTHRALSHRGGRTLICEKVLCNRPRQNVIVTQSALG